MHRVGRIILSIGFLALAAFSPGLAANEIEATASPNQVTKTDLSAEVEQRLIARLQQHIYPAEVADGTISGPGWDFIVREGRFADFFLLGEEHGTAEIPRLAAQLFSALQPSGYSKLVIELSDPIAEDLDQAAGAGIEGIRAYYRRYPPGPAFYSWRDEAALLASVRSAVRDSSRAIWGIDYEVLGDRQMIRHLREKAPLKALPALAILEDGSERGWLSVQDRGAIGGLLAFSGDPQTVKNLRALWPSPDPRSAIILDTLQETLEINSLMRTSGWQSNYRRAQFARKNFMRLLAGEPYEGRRTKALIKMGANHLIRGVNTTGVHDVGALVPEISEMRGGRSFHLLVGGGFGSSHGTISADMSLTSVPVTMLTETFGLSFLMKSLPESDLVVMDLRPLRSLVTGPARLRDLNNPEAVRIIHGYDAILIWNGTTATTTLPLR